MDLLAEWLAILLRWGHVIAAIMWIGDSLLFMWIDSHLSRDPEGRADVSGVTWLLHGGGYYHLEKRLLVPGRLPPRLRWFWLEATSTWITGVLLLAVVYYLSADAFMVDRSVADLTAGQAIAVGVAMLAGGWLLYDGLWRSPLAARPLAALAFSLALLAAICYAATHLLSARAAFLHVGAMLGTIMAANVWVHILPPQRRMVQAAREGRPIDYTQGAHAKTRSTHNSYLTFGTILLMLSPHLPALFVGSLAWIVLLLVVGVGAGIRHVTLVGTRKAPAAAAITLAAAAALVALTARPAAAPQPAGNAPSFAVVRTIVAERCAGCHSAAPTMPGVATAPRGMRLDTPDEIRRFAALIKARAVDQHAMPPGNVTGMTEEERAIVREWVEAGAPLR